MSGTDSARSMRSCSARPASQSSRPSDSPPETAMRPSGPAERYSGTEIPESTPGSHPEPGDAGWSLPSSPMPRMKRPWSSGAMPTASCEQSSRVVARSPVRASHSSAPRPWTATAICEPSCVEVSAIRVPDRRTGRLALRQRPAVPPFMGSDTGAIRRHGKAEESELWLAPQVGLRPDEGNGQPASGLERLITLQAYAVRGPAACAERSRSDEQPGTQKGSPGGPAHLSPPSPDLP